MNHKEIQERVDAVKTAEARLERMYAAGQHADAGELRHAVDRALRDLGRWVADHYTAPEQAAADPLVGITAVKAHLHRPYFKTGDRLEPEPYMLGAVELVLRDGGTIYLPVEPGKVQELLRRCAPEKLETVDVELRREPV